MNADEMQAGRELDWIVAEMVMGWKREPNPRKELVDFPITIRPDGNSALPLSFPHYSTDITDAWQVVEQLRIKGDGLLIKAFPAGFRSKYIAHIPGKDWSGIADVAPLAICRAALKAVGT